MTAESTEFGARLRGYRGVAGLSQEELAELTGLSSRTISNFERGRTRWPYPSTLHRLADALQLKGAARAEFLSLPARRLAISDDVLLAAAQGTADPVNANPAASAGPAMAGHIAGERQVPQQLPLPPHCFTGRATELSMLGGLLNEAAGTVVITAIGGTAGVGKTALALHWAHQVANCFPDGHLYVDLRGFHPSGKPMSPAEAIRCLLDALQVPVDQIPASLDAQAGAYRSLLAGRRMLVVLDNARDAGQVRPLLPGSSGSLVLITSRNQLAGLVAAEGAYQLTLDLLNAAEARELLGRRLGTARLDAEPGGAAELIRLCAGLPLALAIAAARAMASPRLGLGALADELMDAQFKLDALETGDPTVNARAVFSWSLGALPASAVRLFRLLGLHPGPSITIPAAASLAGIAPPQARGALRELTRAHLITEHAPGRYAMHDLLRAYAREQAGAFESEADQQAATRRMLDHYLHTARAADRLLRPGRDPVPMANAQPGTVPEKLADQAQALGWFRAEQKVLLAAAHFAHAAGFAAYAWKLPWTLTVFLDCRGDWQQLIAAHQGALAAACSAGDKTGQASAYRDLARACLRLGRTDDSCGYLGKALRLYQETGDLVGQGRTHLALALAMDTADRYDEAFHHNEQALTLLTQAGDRAGQGNALSSLGWSYAQRGDFTDALVYCHQAIELQHQSDNRYGIAHTLDSIGYIHRNLGRHTQAITCYERSASLFRELGDRCYEADALTNLGDTLNAAGNPQQAHSTWQKALDIFEDLGHPRMTSVRAKLSKPGSANTEEASC